MCRRFRVCGEGGRLESPTGSDLTVFSVVWNAGYRKSLYAIGTNLFSPRAVRSLIEKAFSSWYRNVPTILGLKSSEYALFQSWSFQTPLLQLVCSRHNDVTRSISGNRLGQPTQKVLHRNLYVLMNELPAA